MTPAEQSARLSEWIDANPAPYRMPLDPATYEDEDTLRRSFGSLSAAARREQRRPYAHRANEPWRDDLAVATGDWRGE